MYIWAPENNPSYLNDKKKHKLYHHDSNQFKIDYYAETDEVKRAEMLTDWRAPGNVEPPKRRLNDKKGSTSPWTIAIEAKRPDPTS